MSDYNPPSDRFSTFRAGREELVKTLAEARRTKLEEEVKEFEEKYGGLIKKGAEAQKKLDHAKAYLRGEHDEKPDLTMK